MDENRQSPDVTTPQYDWPLFVAGLVYFLLNIFTIMMGPMRMLPIGGIWIVFLFWSFIAPLGAVVVICFIQWASPKRPFTWLAFAAFLLFLCASAYLNFDTFERAAGSV